MKLRTVWYALVSTIGYPVFTHGKFTVWHQWSIRHKISVYGVGYDGRMPIHWNGSSVHDALMRELERKLTLSVGVAHAYHNEKLQASYLGYLDELRKAITIASEAK